MRPNYYIREHKRFNCEADISYGLFRLKCEGKMYNFSKRGIYFESDREILPSEEIILTYEKLPQKYSDDIYQSLLFKVLWRKRIEKFTFLYGYGAMCFDKKESLIKIFDKVKFRKIILNNNCQPAQTRIKDPRAKTRKICNKPIYIKSKDKIHEGFIGNISSGGAFIKTKCTDKLWDVIQLITFSNKNSKIIKLRACIVRVEGEGLGVKFIKTSSIPHIKKA